MATNRDGSDVVVSGDEGGNGGMTEAEAAALADRINGDFGNLSAYVFTKGGAKGKSGQQWLVGVIGLFEDFTSPQDYERWFADMLRDGDDYQMGRHAAG